MATSRLDRNALNKQRIRRNSQRLRAGDLTSSVRVATPINNNGAAIGLTIASPTSGLFLNSGLSLHLADTSLQLAAGGVSAKLDAAGTITAGAGGLKVGVDGTTMTIAANKLTVGTITESQVTNLVADLAALSTGVAGALLKTGGTMTGQLQINLGTITTSKPLQLTETWNAAGVVFKAIQLDVTNTASAAGSKLLDLRRGGVSQFNVGTFGDTTGASFANGAGSWTVDASGNETATNITASNLIQTLALTVGGDMVALGRIFSGTTNGIAGEIHGNTGDPSTGSNDPQPGADLMLIGGEGGPNQLGDTVPSGNGGNIFVFAGQPGPDLAGTGVGLVGGFNIQANTSITGTLAVTGTTTTSRLALDGTVPGVPADGNMWYDGTNKWPAFRVAGQTATFSGRAYVTTANSSAVSNTTTETDVENGLTLPANFFTVGRTVRITAIGEFSTKVAPAGTFTPRLVLKNGSGTRVAVAAPAFAPGGNDSNARFRLEMTLVCRTTGAAGTLGRIGFLSQEDQAATLAAGLIFIPAGGTTVSIDTTKTQQLIVSIQWGTANVSNTAFLHQLLVEVL